MINKDILQSLLSRAKNETVKQRLLSSSHTANCITSDELSSLVQKNNLYVPESEYIDMEPEFID